MKMNRRSSRLSVSVTRVIATLLISTFLGNATVAYADGHKEDKANTKHQSKDKVSKKGKYKSKKEEIIHEISYLAQKLLDISGEDSVTVRSPAVEKPFIGVCSMVKESGVKLTCITPESQADKNGLKTGDLVTAINGIAMQKRVNKEKDDHTYWGIVHTMKTGDVLKMEILRAGVEVNVDVTVGSLMAPAYVLEVTK